MKMMKESNFEDFSEVLGIWEKELNNPILRRGPPESWDYFAAHGGAVTEIADIYHLYYSGWSSLEHDFRMRLGLATSYDGVKFAKYEGNPIMQMGIQGQWDMAIDSADTVIGLDDRFHMWYDGVTPNGTYRIGHATSFDGIHWIRDSRNPVMDVGSPGEWDSRGVFCNTVMREQDRYVMWYSGLNEKWQIGVATSEDGVNWTRNPTNPVLRVGKEKDWDGRVAYHCYVIKARNGYAMWYAGANKSGIQQLGLAVSYDGFRWHKYPSNPVLKPETAGWDCKSIWAPHVLHDGNTYRIYYSGSDGVFFQTGLAYLKRT